MQDPVVVITGAAGNLGRAVAEAFADQGARVALLDLKAEALAAAFGAESERQMFVAADLMQAADADRAAQAVIQRFGRIDVLVNNAGNFFAGWWKGGWTSLPQTSWRRSRFCQSS